MVAYASGRPTRGGTRRSAQVSQLTEIARLIMAGELVGGRGDRRGALARFVAPSASPAREGNRLSTTRAPTGAIAVMSVSRMIAPAC